MVFPQGIFSEAAMDVLSAPVLSPRLITMLSALIRILGRITVSDVWDIAVMRYSFPLFTRRYPWEGIENFAFRRFVRETRDSSDPSRLLQRYCARLVDFVQRLNALHRAPTWRNLGEVVRRSCRQREVSRARWKWRCMERSYVLRTVLSSQNIS